MESNTQSTIDSNNPMLDQFYNNTKSNVIQITDDKLKNILLENEKAMQSQSSWIAPFTLLLSTILTFCTNTFKEFGSIDAPTWKAFFLFIILGSSIWLIITLIKVRRRNTIDQLIQKIRNQDSTGNQSFWKSLYLFIARINKSQKN